MVATCLDRETDRFGVTTASDAAEGLELPAGRPVDCVVSDHEMPGQNGIEFLETVREVVWVSDPDADDLTYVSPVYEEVWGQSTDSRYENPRAFLDAVHPEDHERGRVFDAGYSTGSEGPASAWPSFGGWPTLTGGRYRSRGAPRAVRGSRSPASTGRREWRVGPSPAYPE